MASFLLLSLLILSNAVQSQEPGTCYTPQGFPLDGQQACNTFVQQSSCCPAGTTCFSNQLCILTDPEEVSDKLPLGTILRGGCTNPLWSNSICGGFCLGSGDDGSITACGNKEYCCNSGIKDRSCDCDSGKGVFSLADGIAQTIIGVSNLEATTIPPVHSRTRTATSNSATTTPSSWSHTTRPSSTGASPTESGASQTSAAATTPLIHRKSFKIGMGVGLGLLLLILAGLIVFWCFWRHYKRQWPFRAKPVTDDTSSDAHHGDDRIPRITQPAPAPFPHPYGPAAVGGAPSPIATPLPQSHQEQSRGASGIAATNNPYDSAYSLRSRDLDDTRYANSHPYGAPQPLERIGESGVPQPGLELQDFRDRDYRGPSRTYHGV